MRREILLGTATSRTVALSRRSPEGIELGHLGDVEAQEQYGVRYLRYWVNQEAREVFCLVDAPHCCASARRR